MEPDNPPGPLILLLGDGIDICHLRNCDEPPEYDQSQLLGRATGIYHYQSDAPAGRNEKDDVLELLAPLGEEKNYTKHYFPKENQMKVFLKGGSNLMVNLQTKQAVYEKLTRRPLISALTKLHYNPGRWWTHFADVFAVGLIIITVTGMVMLKGPKGLWGRGGIELAAGILIPLLFLFL